MLAAEALKQYSRREGAARCIDRCEPAQSNPPVSYPPRNATSSRAVHRLATISRPAACVITRSHTPAPSTPGCTPDTPAYFSAVERSVDSMGDGRDPSGLLNERSAAKLCGVSDEVYAANAAKLRAMKARGEYS